MAKISSLITSFLIFCIKIYRLLISPFVGGCCRFYPTCSIYGIQVLYKFGIVKGSYLLTKRLLKCHPINLGGYDPIPTSNNDKYDK